MSLTLCVLQIGIGVENKIWSTDARWDRVAFQLTSRLCYVFIRGEYAIPPKPFLTDLLICVFTMTPLADKSSVTANILELGDDKKKEKWTSQNLNIHKIIF